MKKAHDDGLAQLWLGDARHMSLPDGSVDCIVTSPPYWSLRKYGEGAQMVWDGEPECEHVWGSEATVQWGKGKETYKTWQTGGKKDFGAPETSHGQFCQLCGSWRGQLGLEPTIELYLDHLLQILDVECRRVLKDSGVMWVNMGDSYAGSWGNMSHPKSHKWPTGRPATSYAQDTLKPLDLCMIPARFASAMQQRGWYLRSIVPWLKQAAMPDSVQGDRWERHRVTECPNCGALASFRKRVCKECGWRRGTMGMAVHGDKAPSSWDVQHDSDPREGRYEQARTTELKVEYVDCPGCPKCLSNDGLVLRKGNWRPGRSMEWLFLFSKTNDYYSDAEGVRIGSGHVIRSISPKGFGGDQSDVFGSSANRPGREDIHTVGRNRRQSDWLYECLDDIIAHHEREARRLKQLRDNGGMLWEDGEPLALLLNPKGYKEAHFATYPIAMVEPLIKAYTSGKGNCPECGAPWVRVVDLKRKAQEVWRMREGELSRPGPIQTTPGVSHTPENFGVQRTTLGWRPSCECDAGEPIPAVICDPFVGSGTTCAAATKLGRRSIGVDCVEEYIALAIKRLGGPFELEVEGVKVKQEGLWDVGR